MRKRLDLCLYLGQRQRIHALVVVLRVALHVGAVYGRVHRQRSEQRVAERIGGIDRACHGRSRRTYERPHDLYEGNHQRLLLKRVGPGARGAGATP